MGKFKIGDSVRLKTDRTETMVVSGYYETTPAPIFSGTQIVGETAAEIDSTRVICSWHDKDGRPQEREYHEDALEIKHDAIPKPIYKG